MRDSPGLHWSCMRHRLPIVMGVLLCLCFVLAGPAYQTSPGKKKPARAGTRKPAQPPISAAMRSAALERVDRYLTASGARPIEQPGALAPFFDRLAQCGGENPAPVHILHFGDS